jgi:hypothetical protein
MRVPSCAHDLFDPRRQSCHCCGIQDHIDFRVADAIWGAVVPPHLSQLSICLRCFDDLADVGGIAYAKAITEVDFIGNRGSLILVPSSALDRGEWRCG